MTREAFIKVLDEKRYSYEIEGDKIIVTHNGYVLLDSLTSLPPGVEFKNGGVVRLDSLTSLPPDVVFKNKGYVDLRSLTSLPPGVVFKNKGDINMQALSSILPDVEFRNEGFIHLNNIYSFPEFYMEGIHPNRILNAMIKRGLFVR